MQPLPDQGEQRFPARVEIERGGIDDYCVLRRPERRGGAVDVLTPQRGEKRALVLLAERNAADALEKRNAQRMIRQERTVGACQALAEAIGMQGYPKRIEGFDISNTQGVLSVASASLPTGSIAITASKPWRGPTTLPP